MIISSLQKVHFPKRHISADNDPQLSFVMKYAVHGCIGDGSAAPCNTSVQGERSTVYPHTSVASLGGKCIITGTALPLLGCLSEYKGQRGVLQLLGKTCHRHSFSHPCYYGPAAATAIGCVERAHRSRSLFFDKLYGQPPSCGNLLMRARYAATRELFCSCGLCRA